jgi:5-methyltetrahydrofolate--homocysteine methyltransferase
MINDIFEAVMEGNVSATTEAVQAALDESLPPGQILNEGMVTAMAEVGTLFEAGEVFVPEMLISARAMQAGLAILRPRLIEDDVKMIGKVVIGTVKGDLHDIGKNLVGMMLEGAGFEVIDLGTDVTPEAFVAAVREHQPQIVGMSALLTTTMASMSKTIEALQEAGVRDQVKVIVGGAPLTRQFAEDIGADLYAPDASSAAKEARGIMSLT